MKVSFCLREFVNFEKWCEGLNVEVEKTSNKGNECLYYLNEETDHDKQFHQYHNLSKIIKQKCKIKIKLQ